MDNKLRLLLPLAGLALLALLASRLSLYHSIDNWVGDRLHKLTAQEWHFDDVVAVDIDDESIFILKSQLGSWPYRRDVFALVVDYLDHLDSQAIVFDILFAEPREGDGAFAGVMQRTGKSVLASRALEVPLNHEADYSTVLAAQSQHLHKPDGLPAQAWEDLMLPQSQLLGLDPSRVSTGVITVPADDDGVMRRMPLVHEEDGYFIPSMPLAAMLGQAPGASLHIDANQVVSFAGHRWPLDQDGYFHLRYPKNTDAFAVVPFYQLVLAALDAPGYEDVARQLRQRVVIIGSSASSLGDYTFSPFQGRMAGLGVLSIAYLDLAHDLLLKPKTLSWDLPLLLLGVVVPFLFIYLRQQTTLQIFTIAATGGMSAVLLSYALMLFDSQMSSLTFVLLLNGLLLTGVMVERYNYLSRERQRLHYEKIAADEANALKSKFLSHVSHELRTPLTAIVGFSQAIIDDDYIDRDERKRRVAIIKQNSHILLELINNLLDKAKIQSGKLALERSPTQVRAMLGDILDSLAPLAGQKGLACEVRFAEGVPDYLCIDNLRLRQIVTNLMGNAIKFTSQGEVDLEVEWQEGWLTIRVSDSGPGIAGDSLAKVFEAFEQTDSSVARVHGGSGLGLNISLELARLMGGDLAVESQLGVGSTFTLGIPAEASDYLPPAQDTPEPTARLADIPTKKILVVDDTRFIRDLLSMLLNQQGHVVGLAEDGEQAIAQAREFAPDVILMDIEMPLMDGKEALAVLRQSGFPGRIIAMTAHSATDNDMCRFGFDGQIAKPIDTAQLFAALER